MRNLAVTFLIITVMLGCSKGDMIRLARIATTGDVAAARQMAAAKAVKYAADPKSVERDIKRFRKDFANLIENFRKAVLSVWGGKEIKEPRPKEYVKYTQNYLSRASVDFDRGIIIVETLTQHDYLKSLKNAIVTTLLTPDDPRAVDLYSAKTVKLGQKPFLYLEVKDHENKYIRWPWRAERFAEHLIKTRLQTRQIKTGNQTKTVHYVTIPMVKDHLQVRARKYSPFVERFAKSFSISKNLIFAIIKTESDFNPYAVSNAPAFGLMQIVPTRAGKDVQRFFNRRGIPSKRFLFNPENNIRYGAAYLHLLHYKYLNDIRNPVSREYCVIAAYNAGAGNVFSAFDREKSRASQKINKSDPLKVFNILRTKLPSNETRRYLVKVMEAKKKFVNF